MRRFKKFFSSSSFFFQEPIENVDENTIFDLERHGKLHVLSAGTRIVQHTPPAKMQGGMKGKFK
jgi:hypothetical protein